MAGPLIVIYNPVCGDKTTKEFFDAHVFPLLSQHGKQPDMIIETLAQEEHPGTILLDYLKSSGSTEEVTVILGSGDGTLHDIINSLASIAQTPVPRIHFALVPCGTANALYSSHFPPPEDASSVEYRLRSVSSYLEGTPSLPLRLAITTLSPAPGASGGATRTPISVVVVSTSLHASILRDSEALRGDVPGIERFKIAAERNSTNWYQSSVKLYPSRETGVVQIYDPQSKTFISHPDSDEEEPIVDLDGPFIYFLSTVNVDRLEPTFRITPLASSIPPNDVSCELIVVRPLRDPIISWDNPQARAAFVPKLWAVMKGAYENGNHVGLQYSSEGELSSEGVGPLVVEYIRCGGWEWVPDAEDERAHILCADGAILELERGGRAVCRAAAPSRKAGFMIYGA